MTSTPELALQIVNGGDGTYRWVILQSTDSEPYTFQEHSLADDDYATYELALIAGAVALAKAQGEPYEDERADPVGS